MSIKLEVGKTYLNKLGQKTTIIKYRPNSLYPYRDEFGGTFTENGYYQDGVESLLDLITEENGLKLEVGKTYLNRSGEKVTIHKYEPSYAFPFIGAYTNGDETSFREDGVWYSNYSPSDKDLISEVKESYIQEETYTKEQVLKAIKLARGYSNDEILKMI